MELLTLEYKNWLIELKGKIRNSQIKAAVAVNAVLIEFYWDLGKMISEKQTAWGSKFLDTLAADLQNEFPEMKGFSVTNLKYCRLFYSYLLISPQAGDEIKLRPQVEDKLIIHPQLGDELQLELLKQIPWGHIKLLIGKIKDKDIALFYVKKIIEHNWSRDILDLQIKSNLHLREGKSINNFKNTLPEPFSDLANQIIKDPYIFDFLALSESYQEKDIEKQLVQHITKFLLELGKGFAFIGQQYPISIGEKDYRIDLLFYHTKLRCYVVIELKNEAFKPEFTGKLNFYLSAIDTLLKDENEKPTIGILLCKDKNNVEAEFALRDINKPIGISDIQFTGAIPDNLKSSLPTIEEIENKLNFELLD
jgi:predicted nuclease of restriction endonuclease-like (RecB) superfamily